MTTAHLAAMPDRAAWRLLLILHKRAPQQIRANVALATV